jgi:hypothetical protein
MGKTHGSKSGNVGSKMGKGVSKKGGGKATRPPLSGPAKDIKWPKKKG